MTRLREIYEHEGRERVLEAGTRANETRAHEKRERNRAALLVSNKAANETKNKPEFNIEEAYEAAIERTAKKEPQPKPESINMRTDIHN